MNQYTLRRIANEYPAIRHPGIRFVTKRQELVLARLDEICKNSKNVKLEKIK